MKKNLVGYKPLRKLLKREVNGAVSKEAIIFLQTHIDEEIKSICIKSVEEQKRMNSRYEAVGIPQRKSR